MPAKRDILVGWDRAAISVTSRPDPESGAIQLPAMDILERGNVASQLAAAQPEQLARTMIIDGLLKVVQPLRDAEEIDLTTQQWAFRVQNLCGPVGSKSKLRTILPGIQSGLYNVTHSRTLNDTLRAAAERGLYELKLANTRSVVELGQLAVEHHEARLFNDSINLMHKAIFDKDALVEMGSDHPIMLRNALGVVQASRLPTGRPAKMIDELWGISNEDPARRCARVQDLGAKVIRFQGDNDQYSRVLPATSYPEAVKTIWDYATGDYHTRASEANVTKIDTISEVVLDTAQSVAVVE